MINCNRVPLKDKGCHFLVGLLLAFGLAFIIGGLAAFGIAIVAGVAKEGYDQYKYRGADFFDLFATVLGAVGGLFAYQALMHSIKISPLFPISF